MKYIKQSLLLIISILFSFIFITSCDVVQEEEIGGTSTEKLAGDWYIIGLENDGTTPAYGGDYVLFSTYNTAANDGTMWVDDHETFFELKTKVSTSDYSFNSPSNITNLYGGTSKITNGVITPKSYTTESGTKVDAISFDIEFDWDPGYIYKFKGHKRTGFSEDENPHYH